MCQWSGEGGDFLKAFPPPFIGAFRPRPSSLFLRWFGAAVAEIGSAKGEFLFLPLPPVGRREEEC